MSGKQTKKERKAAREAEREAHRRQERQRTIFTAIVIAVVVAIGGVLVWVSLDDPGDEDLADLLDDLESPTPGEEGEEPADDATGEDDRPVACGAEEPEGAGTERGTFSEPEQVIEEGSDYRAVVQTSCGTVVVDLDEESTPEAVNNFVFLAQQGFFDGQLIFRNATSIGALQTGAGDDQATWDIGYTLADELETAEADGYPAGSVAMANSGPDTAGSQFFFVYDDSFQEAVEGGGLGPTYTRFGEVVEGLEVLQEIGAIPVEGETPTERVYMETVTIETDS